MYDGDKTPLDGDLTMQENSSKSLIEAQILSENVTRGVALPRGERKRSLFRKVSSRRGKKGRKQRELAKTPTATTVLL